MGSMPVRLLVVVVCIGLVLVLTRLVRRRFHYTVMEPNNEFAGFMYSMIGLVYGVYLAFTIIAACVFVFANLATDVLYMRLDPRLRERES